MVLRRLGILVAVLVFTGMAACSTSGTPRAALPSPPPPAPQRCLAPDETPAPGDAVCFSGQLDQELRITTSGTPDAPVYYRGNGTVVPGIRVNADNVVVEGFVSKGAESTGIVANGENVTVRDNEITQVDYAGDDVDAIRFFGDGAQILNNHVYDLEGNEVEDSHVDCIQTFAVNMPGSSDVVIQGNRCEGIRAQCLMAEGPNDEGGSGEGVSRNWLFDGNYCDAHADAQSVALEDVQDVTISNNDMVGEGNKAFALGRDSTGVVVRDNRIGPDYGREVGFDDPSAAQGYQGPPAE
ncbi:right-handed parallel beta-helix repeat-containing protein [Pseudonocardia adelaidensis]|uniref:Right handed beta helix domain-containing protein n=1 Tax=Pseudonocardia adelaidensis TaxID=648754 RepID=A0ABP9N904_9PSEU